MKFNEIKAQMAIFGVLCVIVLSSCYWFFYSTEKIHIHVALFDDARRYCIQQAIFETGTDPSKWADSKYIYAVVVLSRNSFKIQLEGEDEKPVSNLIDVYKTTDNEFIFENGDKVFDGQDYKTLEEKYLGYCSSLSKQP